MAEKHLVLPFRVEEDRICLAMADPTNDRVVDELSFVTGKTIVRYAADPSALRRAIGLAYGSNVRHAPAPRDADPLHLGPTRRPSRAFALAVVLPDRDR